MRPPAAAREANGIALVTSGHEEELGGGSAVARSRVAPGRGHEGELGGAALWPEGAAWPQAVATRGSWGGSAVARRSRVAPGTGTWPPGGAGGGERRGQEEPRGPGHRDVATRGSQRGAAPWPGGTMWPRAQGCGHQGELEKQLLPRVTQPRLEQKLCGHQPRAPARAVGGGEALSTPWPLLPAQTPPS
ncbi:hypothetical protein KIL84_005686 [Mauremys mutica]|uniref:Uncharacterized protein n=1 Tax=Mauremys mutica TaxID=74926 RepID=A0A9D3XH61_9SAUR|nr:hypothetical protein KIL84_005686 [Mauremys mutica]